MLKKLKGAGKVAFARVPKVKLPKSSGEQYVVGLDIGTENVKALIAKVKGDQIEIIGVGKSHQSLTDMQAGAVADIAAVTANCDEALAQAEEQAGLSAKSVVVGIAGELVKGTTHSVRISRKDAQKPLDEAEVSKIIKLVQERALKSAKQQLSIELGGKDVDVRLVNSALVRMQIDGYDVTNPIGFQGREIMVQLYTAFAPMIHIGALERVVAELDLELTAVAAEPFAVARAVVGDEENTNTTAILMDVGGGTTDIAVVNEGGVEGTKMFGIGGRAFTKSIERNMGVTYAQAEAIKLGLGEGRVPHNKVPSIESALNKTMNVWLSGVELALSEFTIDTMPHRMLLCGGGASLGMLVEALQDQKWYTNLPFTRQPQVQYLNPAEVVGMTDKTDSLHDHTFITAMGLLRVAADTLSTGGTKSAGSTIKDRFNRLLRV
jgi:cell division protein FtsA